MNNYLTWYGKLLVLAVLTVGLGVLTLRWGPPSRADSQDQIGKAISAQDKPLPENGYKFSDPTPSGDWLAQPDVDVFQSNDPDVPVVIAGIRSYVGKGNWRKQLMIESVVLKNRTPKVVTAVKLGWIIISERDVIEKKNREVALAQGYTQLFDPELQAQGMRRAKPISRFCERGETIDQGGRSDRNLFS